MTNPSSSHHHPASLKIFFATEMWERYGFYVVQTLLALYLALHFKWDDNHVYPLVGSFTALTYLSPVVGGWIADHLLGQKRTILAGAAILFFSYILLSFVNSAESLSLSLAGIAVGTGLLKPNISSLLGNEYSPGSSNRERGFTIFYMGITTGIILGTTLPSYLQSWFGWNAAFLSSSFGMIIAVITFVFGIYHYQIKDYTFHVLGWKHTSQALLLIILLWSLSFYILNKPSFADALFIGIGIFSVIYLLLSFRSERREQRNQTLVIGLLCLISIVFWSFYFQMFMSLTLFLKRVVQPNLFGIPFPPPYYVAVQSIGMIVIGLFLGRKRQLLTVKEHTIQVGNKFLLSMICMIIAYAGITAICFLSGKGLLSPLYFIPAFLMISLAELLLSPVGLSAITLLSSQKKVSTMMGIFFVSLGLGGFFSGKLAILTAISQNQLNGMPLSDLKLHYGSTFLELFLILVLATIFCAFFNTLIKRLMN